MDDLVAHAHPAPICAHQYDSAGRGALHVLLGLHISDRISGMHILFGAGAGSVSAGITRAMHAWLTKHIIALRRIGRDCHY